MARDRNRPQPGSRRRMTACPPAGTFGRVVRRLGTPTGTSERSKTHRALIRTSGRKIIVAMPPGAIDSRNEQLHAIEALPSAPGARAP